MTTPHPQADLLRAIADGKQMQQDRTYIDSTEPKWTDCSSVRALYLISCEESDLVRIKPDTVTIKGIEYPAPMRVEPEMGSCYYAPAPTREAKFISWSWSNDASDQRFLAEGLCFATAEDAAAAARAMIAPLKGGAE